MNFTTFYLLLCIIFAGRGDERWKKQAKENSHIVQALRESAEMERDLWPYDDNLNTENEFFSNVNYKLLKHKKHRERYKKPEDKSSLDKLFSNSMYIKNRLKNISSNVTDLQQKNVKIKHDTKPKWPKFKELLLSVGVEYDFKSDRWIKLKVKHKTIPDETIKHFNNEVTHQKHEFKYRTIRINGSKRRKNIIIALTAIR